MKKVANCFMSLGSVSRARTMFNSVMAMNSCRVVLIALVMLVCGNLSVFAQIKDGDIVTIAETSYELAGSYGRTVKTELISQKLVEFNERGDW